MVLGRAFRSFNSPLAHLNAWLRRLILPSMGQLEKFIDTIAQYSRHGWQTKRLLATRETGGALAGNPSFQGIEWIESEVDAIWFTRPSSENREAWELRLIADTPYALFETFETDEPEELREDLRMEMEARLREYVKPA
jgi:hypothetical protein